MRKSILVFVLAAALLLLPFGTTDAAADTNESIVYSYLTGTIGFNEAAACGIMANIEAESDFEPTLYGDDGTSYGICQWHSSRFTSLKTWCSGNGYDYTTLSGQLHYLQKELSANNSSYLYNGLTIYNYMTNESNVPNTAAGAYEAGRYWCVKYEVPANATAVSQVRGARARDYFWEEYVVNGGANLTDSSTDSSSVTDTSISISGVTKPVKVTYGTLFTLTGDLRSQLAITSVTAAVYDMQGNVMTSASTTPNKTSCSIEGYLDNHIYISKLKPGKYTYVVTAANSAGTYTLVNANFTVIPKSTSIKSITGKRKKLQVKWTKRAGCATGYEILYSTSKTFKKAKTKTKTVKNKSKTSVTIKNLKAGKTYYVKIRTYRTYTTQDGKTQKVYSSWSKKKKVRVY